MIAYRRSLGFSSIEKPAPGVKLEAIVRARYTPKAPTDVNNIAVACNVLNGQVEP